MPPFAIHVLPQRMEKMRLVGTVTMFFAAVNVMRVVPYFSLGQLSRDQHNFIPDEMHSYFRDVYDHAVRANEQVENFREMLNSVLGANLTQVTVQQNDDVRKISAWVAILAVPTMIAGIYGMNFDHMPELRWRYSYPAVLAFIAACCFALYRNFKHRGWL